MKRAMLACTILAIKGLEFDSGKNVAYTVEDNRSFMLPETHPAVKKIGLGDIVDITYTHETKKPTVVKSGAEVDFYTVNGVTVDDIRKSMASERFQDLPDVELPKFTDYTTTGGTTGEDTGKIGKM